MNSSNSSVANSETLGKLDKLIYPILTTLMHIIYDWKLMFNLVIGSLLGTMLALGTVPDDNRWGKAYIALALVIICDLMFDRYIRSKSRTFDMSNSLNDPIVLKPGRRELKVIYYNKYKHILTLSFLDLLELIKVGAGIFCVYDLIKLNPFGVFINYCLFALLSVETGIGIITYSNAIFLLIVKQDAFITWLNYIAEHYIRDTCSCTFTHINGRIYREYGMLDDV